MRDSLDRSVERYLRETWVDPRQVALDSRIHGKGAFAREEILCGERVEVIGGDLMTDEQFSAFQERARAYNAVQIDEGLHLVERQEVTHRRTGSINHSCDSNLWMADEVTLVARRDIAAGEELTVDYSLFSARPEWSMERACRCGSPQCRRIVTGNDWELKNLQARYSDHFSPFLNRRIRQASGEE